MEPAAASCYRNVRAGDAMGDTMRVRSAVVGLLFVFAAGTAPAQAPSTALARISEAEALLAEQSRAVFATAFSAMSNPDALAALERGQAARAAQTAAIVAAIDRDIAATPRSANAADWGALQVAKSIAQEAEMFSGGEAPAARATIDAALASLTRDAAPYVWARAQLQRGRLLLLDLTNEDGSTNPAVLEGVKAASAAARTVLTPQAYPRDYLAVQCQLRAEYFAETPSPDAQLRMAALAPTCAGSMTISMSGMSHGDSRRVVIQQFNSALMMEPMLARLTTQGTVMPGGRGLFGGGARRQMEKLAREQKDAIQQSMEAVRAQTDGGRLVDQISEGRAAFLSAALSMERLGLSPAELARARALRTKADTLAAQTTPANLNANADYWRALAELHDIIDAARPPQPAPIATDDPVLAVLMLTEARGYAAVKPPSGAGKVFATDVNRESVRLTMAAMPTFSGRPGILPNPFGAFSAARRTQQMQQRFEDAQRRVTDENAQLMASADISPAEAWTRLYATRDFVAAIDDFRVRFEPQFAPMLHQAAASAAQPGGRLVIMPDGAGSMLPIGLLRDPATGKTLIEQYEIAYTPSLAAYDASRRRSRAASAPSVAVVAPSYAESGLAFIESEAALTRAPFRTSVAVSAQATPELLRQLGQASYWHFATHGYFDPHNPRASWLQIPGGARLTLGDILFSGAGASAPRLVVLSACESGLFDATKDPENFVGLPTGFLQAGAAGVIATLWQVSDVSATLLMAQFYEQHRTVGERPSAALRHAQLWLKDADKPAIAAYVRGAQTRGVLSAAQADALIRAVEAERDAIPYGHPYHWGAFVYYGA